VAKVLFINPVIREDDNPSHIPYGLAQLIAICAKEGHLIQVFDANAWRPTDDETRDAISSDSWDVIAIGGLVTTYGYIKKTIQIAKEIFKDALIIAGGGFITPIPFEIMDFLPAVDIGVIGEAYLTLPEILAMVDEGSQDWGAIKGIVFRNNEGKVELTEERTLFDQVDTLPFPAWEYFPLDIYFKNSSLLLSEEAMLSKRHISIIASYGCPYKCKYCFHLGLSGELAISDSDGKRELIVTSKRKVRWHSPEYIIELIRHAKERFGVDFVSFLDENFAVLAKNKKWFEKFEELWIKEGLQPECIRKKKAHNPAECKGIHWGTTAHPAIVNEEMLIRFKNLGCSHLDYGLESFSDEVLKSIGKGSTARQNTEAIKMTMKAGIRPIPNQIIGFPEDSFESIRANINAWNNLGIRVYPFFATPYPGSEWYFKYKNEILEQYDGSLEDFILDLGDATKITAVISEQFNAVELLGLRELMVNRDLKRINNYEKYKDNITPPRKRR